MSEWYVGVFSTKEAAQAASDKEESEYKNKHGKDAVLNCDILSFTVDELVTEN